MATVYKLTTRNGRTHGDTHWLPGEWREVRWGGRLCEPGCLHAYSDPLLAALMDPVHAALLPGGTLWVAEGNVLLDDGTKLGCDRLRIIREHDLPVVSMTQRTRWAIYCARRLPQQPAWERWADAWLIGDVSAHAAHATASATHAAATAAATHAAASATYAANATAAASAAAASATHAAATAAATHAAASATYAANATAAASATHAAAYAAHATAAATHAAAAAHAATHAAFPPAPLLAPVLLDLLHMAIKAITEGP